MSCAPLVIVEGFLSGSGAIAWGKFEAHLNRDSTKPRRVLFATVGPVSSLHDRACELYYALLGGQVDYGELHAKDNNHARYGRTHEQGLYPTWSIQNPLHFLGHSMGGATIIKLQALLERKYFSATDHPDMIRSVTSISSPFRGTQAVYSLGECADTRNFAPSVRPFSCGSILTRVVHIVAYLSPLLPSSLDLHADSRSLSYRNSSFSELLAQLWKSDWAESRDATPFDVTFEAADERERDLGEGAPNPTTFYQSHVAMMTSRRNSNDNTHAPTLNHAWMTPLYVLSRLIGTFDFTSLHPTPTFVTAKEKIPTKDRRTAGDIEQNIVVADSTPHLDEEYWANDGVVPVFSQWHPLPCGSTRCSHSSSPTSTPQAGIWHVHEIADATHLSIAPFWFGTARQIEFWQNFGDWLKAIDIGEEVTTKQS